MPKLADLYGVDLNRLGKYRPEYTSVMERPLALLEEKQRAAPVDREYTSGRLEALMFFPDGMGAMAQDFAEKRGEEIASR